MEEMQVVGIRPGICLLAFCAFALAEHAFSSDGSTSVQLQLRGNFPLFIVKIDGIDVPLTFDLGDSSALTLSPKILSRIKTTPTNKNGRFTDVQGNIIESVEFEVPLVQIGAVIFKGVVGKTDLHDPSYQAADMGQQGHVGTGLFKAYKVVLDYPHRRMVLIPKDARRGQKEECRGTVVPFLADWHGDPVTKATMNGRELTAVWDTGSPISILRKVGGQDIGDDVLKNVVTTSHLYLGGTDFGSFKLFEADYEDPPGTDMFIGYNFFAKHAICIDFPENRFLIQR